MDDLVQNKSIMKYIGVVCLFIAAVCVGHWAVSPWTAEKSEWSSTIEEPKKNNPEKEKPEEPKKINKQ